MISLTLTTPTNKPGQIAFFPVLVEKARFLEVMEMEFDSPEELLQAEKDGLFKIQK